MTESERSAAVELGYRLSGGLLIEQANATRTIAVADMPAFKAEGILADTAIANLDALITQVHKGLEDRATAASEARAQTAGQAAAVRDLKVKRRRLDHSVDRVFRSEPAQALYRQHNYRGASVAAICNDMNIRLAFAKEHAAQLAPVGINAAFLSQLEADIRALEKTSGSQDAAISQLPESTRQFCEARGKLYAAIKDINHAGHALHAGDLEAAAKYNAKVLYPRRGKAKPDAAPPVATK
jgi:hypothetical protein